MNDQEKQRFYGINQKIRQKANSYHLAHKIKQQSSANQIKLQRDRQSERQIKKFQIQSLYNNQFYYKDAKIKRQQQKMKQFQQNRTKNSQDRQSLQKLFQITRNLNSILLQNEMENFILAKIQSFRKKQAKQYQKGDNLDNFSQQKTFPLKNNFLKNFKQQQFLQQQQNLHKREDINKRLSVSVKKVQQKKPSLKMNMFQKLPYLEYSHKAQGKIKGNKLIEDDLLAGQVSDSLSSQGQSQVSNIVKKLIQHSKQKIQTIKTINQSLNLKEKKVMQKRQIIKNHRFMIKQKKNSLKQSISEYENLGEEYKYRKIKQKQEIEDLSRKKDKLSIEIKNYKEEKVKYEEYISDYKRIKNQKQKIKTQVIYMI